MGRIFLLLLNTIVWMIRPPYRLHLLIRHMEFVGVKSSFVTILTGTFSGMVLALQSYHGLRIFSAEGMVGGIVALGMTREMGPVITGLMVAGRAGSAMAAEIGTMKVTEQVDALSSMAVNPVQYLIVPRFVAGLLMVPMLTIMSDFVGILGGYFVGVILLGIDHGVFVGNIIDIVDVDDIIDGLIKAITFGGILTFISCYKGYYTEGGAEGVGRATTEAVVLSCILILAADYVLTSMMF
jgi:phospholipid/cholesterol/gamma-HCH transport system permease protein